MSPTRRLWLNVAFYLRVSAALVVLSSATDITATEPDDAAQLNELAESVDHPAWEIAIRERAYRAAHESEHPAAVRAMFAQKWLALSLELGLTKQALAVWESLPASWRYRTLDSSINPGARSHHRRVTDQHADLDMDLAAASILEGRLDLARQLVTVVAGKLATAGQLTGDSGTGAVGHPIPRPTRWERPEYVDDTARLAILQECLEPSETDAFDLLVGVMATSFDHGPWFRFGTWERLLSMLADREGYPSLARYLRRSATWKLDDEWWHLRALPDAVKTPELIAAATRAEDAINGLRARLLQQVPPRSTATSRSPVDETVRRLIGAPKIVELRERTLPKGIVPIAMTYEQERDHREALRSEHNLPFPHEIIRVESRGDSVVALGASQDYDPVGELSRGAYWVFHSQDGGASWQPPLYTGLRITMPYVVRPRSDLPLIRRSGLRIEVEVRELDLDFIMFPPIATRTKREAHGLYLDLPWELLERDSDGDGLTDLAEERLITDPHQADTDADGSDDGVDLLPQVPHRVGTDDRTRLMQTILDNTLGGMRPIVHEVGDLDPDADPGQVDRRQRGATHASERTAFLVGDRAWFRGTTPGRRTIVLSSEEHAAAQAKFGPIYATRYPVLTTNRAGTMAFVIWSAQWRGGEAIVEKVDGEWEFAILSTWIT